MLVKVHCKLPKSLLLKPACGDYFSHREGFSFQILQLLRTAEPAVVAIIRREEHVCADEIRVPGTSLR